MLVEAAWTAVRSPGPLRAFGERIRTPHGAQVAAVAVARKIAVIAWQLLTKDEDYAFGRRSLTRAKLRALERKVGAPRLSNRHRGQRISASVAERQAERDLAERGEKAYRRLGLKQAGEGESGRRRDTGARILKSPVRGQAARRAQAPRPAP